MNRYANVYRHAASLIQDRGWCHKGGLDDDGRICLLIAVTMAAVDRVHDDELSGPAGAIARCVDPDARSGSVYAVIAYNEAPDRTETEVINLLQKLSET